jgi:hypothetical protein
MAFNSFPIDTADSALAGAAMVAAIQKAHDLTLNFYVDSVDGLDTNSGTSRVAPFKTLTKLNTLLISGSVVYLNNGSTFYDFIDKTVDNVLISTYGTGNKPVIDCSDPILASAFSKTAGQTNVYESTITLPNNSKIMGNIYYNDLAVKQVTSIALVDAESNTAFVADWTAASTTLYVNKGGSAPIDGEYRYSAREHGIDLIGNSNEIFGVICKKNANQDGSIKMSGLNVSARKTEMNDGCRHSAYFQASCYLDSLIFKGARNDLEGSANTLVVNEPNVAGKSYITTDCTFDGDGDPRVTGPQNHGADANELFAKITHTRPVFIDLEQSVDIAAQDTQITLPIFNGCDIGLFFGRNNGVATMTGATGTAITFIKAEAPFTSNTIDSVITCNKLEVGFYKAEDTASNVSTNNDTITVLDADLTSRFFRVQGGTLTVKNSEFLPSIAFPAQTFYNCGYSGGTIAYVGENNTFPYGAKFDHNGVVYNTLTDFKAATGATDTTSITAPLPNPSFFDTFGRADGDLAQGLWSYSGAAAQAAIDSNTVSITGTTLSLYSLPPMASADHYSRAIVGNNNAAGPFPLIARAQDQLNWIGVRWTTSQFQLWRSVAGSLSQIGTSSGVTPAVDDEIVIAVRGKYAYFYVNGNNVINRLDIGTDLATGRLCGLVSRSTAVSNVIKEFSCGVI